MINPLVIYTELLTGSVYVVIHFFWYVPCDQSRGDGGL